MYGAHIGNFLAFFSPVLSQFQGQQRGRGDRWGQTFKTKNLPLYREIVSKQFLWIAYLETSELKGSKST